MTKTEKLMIEQINQRGHAVFFGSRAFTVLKKLQDKYPQYVFRFYTGGTSQGKSGQGVKYRPHYEVAVLKVA